MYRLALATVFVFTFSYVSNATGDEKGVQSAPAWVKKTPIHKDRLCAVGTCEPTFYPEDAKPCAADGARAELSKSILVKVYTVMLDELSISGENTEEASMSSVSAYVSEAVLENAVVEQYWYDSYGIQSPKKGVTYAIACMPRKEIRKVTETDKVMNIR